MNTYFVTRHKGAVEWAGKQGIEALLLGHLDVEILKKGDRVLGSLPVHLAAEVCRRGAEYHHLVLDLPPELRGKELTAEDMDRAGAILKRYEVMKKGDKP